MRKCAFYSILLSLVAAFSSGVGAVNCFDFTGAAYRHCVEKRFASLAIDLNASTTIAKLTDSIRPEKFEPPADHHQGYTNAGLYLHEVHGFPSLIKVFSFGSETSDKDEAFLDQVFGYLLAQDIGGPQVSRAGKIKELSGKSLYYIEMEKLFPQQSAVGYKSLTVFYPTLTQMKKLSRLFLWAIERHVQIGDDVDFLFHGDDIHWIDAGTWRAEGFRDRHFFDAMVEIVDKAHCGNNATGERFC